MTDRTLIPTHYGWRSDLLLCLLGALFLWLGGQSHFYWYFPACALLTARLWLLPREADADRSFLAGALLLVLVCLSLTPDLSDDYHRYLWEGYAQNQGYSPFVHAPRSLYEKLDHPSEGLINNDGLSAIYPPLAQSLFRVAAWLDDSVFGWKLILLLGLLPLVLIYKRTGLIFWLASPVVLFEGIWNVHLDVLGLVPAILMMRALDRSRAGPAGFWLGVLTALKIMPVIFFPFCFLYFAGRDRWRFSLTFLAIPVLFYLPYLDQWPHLFTSFVRYSRDWSFNNPLFIGLHAWLPGSLVRLTLGLLFLGVFLWLMRADRPIRWKLFAVWTALTVLSPTVYPWYLIWFLPFVPREKAFLIHGAYLAAFLSYLVLVPFRASGVWQERFWWMAPEWIALLFCFARSLTGSWAKHESGSNRERHAANSLS